jgi:hypothetical protein
MTNRKKKKEEQKKVKVSPISYADELKPTSLIVASSKGKR